jgi:hypothetical protein
VIQPLHKLTAEIRIAPPETEAWAELASNALEPAGGSLPDWVEPQLRWLIPGNGTAPTGIWRDGKLAGVAALERQTARWLPGWPVDVSLETPLFFSGLPLISRLRADDAVAALIGERGVPLILGSVSMDGPFWDSLCRSAKRLNAPLELMAQWQRACLKLEGNHKDWFEGNFDRKRRKEYKRWRARLGELGKLESRQWQPGEPLQPWFDDLCALEAKGWKGQRGSAIACDSKLLLCLEEALDRLGAARQLRFWSITLDGQAIATMFAIVAGERAWLGKIAFDEAHAKYSPGVLQILDATESLFAEGGITLVDSCAVRDHPMIDNIWRDRIAIGDVLIGTPGMLAARFRAMAAAERLRRRARLAAKDVYHRFFRRQKS